jgi:hypothetical protein
VSWAASRIDTLILVTADHETGGLKVLGDSGPGALPEVSWFTTGHTSASVPVYAWGFGAEAVSGVFDNTDIYHLIQNAGAIYQSDRPTACDFNGDGMSDYAVVRSDTTNSLAYLFIRYTNSDGRPGDFAQVVPLASGSTDLFLNGDFDGDRLADIGLFRETWAGVSWWHNRHSSNLNIESTVWGVTGDIPVATDIDGDGKGDRTVFRSSDGSWWSARTALGPIQLSWGLPGDLPVSADYDRDGWDDIAVWRPSSGYWAVLQSSRASSPAAEDVVWRQWGLPGDHPLPGDFDGDGKADLAVWRPSNGTWYVCSSLNRYNCSEGRAVQFGLPGDYPVRSDFDGDGILDFVVWRETNGIWFVRRSSDDEVMHVQWGLSGDIPLCQGIQSLLTQ